MTENQLNDIPYTWGYYGEMNPTFLNYVSVLGGYVPPDVHTAFTYCELGCGNGVNINVQAQLYPNGHFVGIDLNPVHVENASEVGAEAGLSNTSFLATDIGDLGGEELPDFDYIALHGLYSWVGEETREIIHNFIGTRLKPGGIVYISYNTLPGWSALLPLRELMRRHTADLSADILTRTQAGLDYLVDLKKRGIGYFEDNAPAAAFLDEIVGQDITYVAHEFFGANAAPFYFTDVLGSMESLGLKYASSAILNLNFIDVAARAEHHQFLSGAKSRAEFEATGDFIRNQRFRKDVYIREPRVLEPAEHLDMLLDIPFGTRCDVASFARLTQFGDVELKYQANLFGDLIEACATGAKTIRTLCEMPAFSAFDPALVADAMKFLTVGGQMLPFSRTTDDPGDQGGVDRYELPTPVNLALLKRRLFKSPQIVLAAPNAGTGLEVSMIDALFALCSAEAPAAKVGEWALSRTLEAGQQLAEEGGGESAAMESALQQFRDTRLKKFVELGILAPAP